MKKLIFLFFLSMLCMQVSAQDFISVSGKVLDSQNGRPVPAASVNLSGTNISIVTNAEGIFSLKIPVSMTQNGKIVISHLGYENGDIPVSDFEEGSMRTIRMNPVSIELDAAVVRYLDADKIFKAAMIHIKDNYPTERMGMTTFYREMIRKDNIKYLVLNEAVVDVDKAAYGTLASDKASIFKGRGTVNFNPSDTLFVKFKGGIMSALSLDVAKDPFVETNPATPFEDYHFSLDETVSIGDKAFYALSFTPVFKAREQCIYKGRVYIDPESYAIARAEFWLDLNESNKTDAAALFIVKMPSNTRFTIEQAKYEVNFKQNGDKWYFDYSKTDLVFTARRTRSLLRHVYSIVSEIAVTDHKPDLVTIQKADKVSRGEILTDDIEAFSDPDFWEDYNVIEPEQSIQNAIQRIIRQLNRRN